MVEAHTLDAWTREADRSSRVFGYGAILGGFGAPLFLFLAGVAVMLAIGRRAPAAGLGTASRSVERRGWEIFGLAFLFRLQAKLLSGGPWASILKVDILNIMGPAIAGAAATARLVTTCSGRLLAFGATAVAIAMLTPPVRMAPWLSPLPDAVEGYLRPIPGLTNFTLFPWAGFVVAGAFAGVLLERSRDEESERRLNLWFLAGGLVLTAGGYALSFAPPLYSNASFWTSSPTFFCMRVGLLTLGLPLAYGWTQRRPMSRWTPVQQFGRTSLFVYWIHIEMVYGILSRDLHRSLTIAQWLGAYVVFLGVLLALSLLKDRAVAWWRSNRS
jgi:uncharacterized membrane protein